MFVVMIGRLSYADPPDWLDAEAQTEIEKLTGEPLCYFSMPCLILRCYITEPARDLMDLIIEGPEGDSVWVAYQDAEDGNTTENDEDIQVNLLDADVDETVS